MQKKTLIAVGVFVVLLGAFLLTRERNVSVGIPKVSVSIDKTKVQSIEVSGPFSVRLEKSAGSWSVLDPKQADKKYAADETQVTAAIDALGELKAPDYVSDKQAKHAEFEVDDAKGLRVTVLGENGLRSEFVLGKAAKAGGTYFRQPGRDEIFSTPSGLPWMLRKDVNGWRRRQFITGKLEDLAKLEITHADSSSMVLIAKDGAWELDPATAKPAGFRFDAAAAQRIAQQFVSMSAQEFADGAVDEQRLGGAHTVLKGTFKDGRTTTLRLGAEPDPEEAPVAAQLQGQFTAVDVAPADGKVTLSELEKIASDTTKAEEPRKAATTLVKNPALFARLDVGLWGSKAKDDAISNDDLQSATRTAGTVLTGVDGDAQAYLIPSYQGGALRKRLGDLRDTQLLSFEVEKATRLTINGAKKVVAVKEGGAWRVTEPKKLPDGLEFDPGQVATQVNTLRHLRALRVVDGVTAAAAGLARPSATVEIEVEGGAKHVLRFGQEFAAQGGARELYVQGSIDPLIYAVAPFEKTRLDQGVELFRKPAPPPNFGGPGGIKGLENLPPEVRAQLEAQMRSGAFR